MPAGDTIIDEARAPAAAGARRHWQMACAATIVVVFVTAVVTMVAAETFLRVTRAHVTPDTLRHASLEYEATLFARHAFPRMVQRKQATPSRDVEINEHGYRGRAFAVRKPPGEIRIVVLGGSSVFDMYAAEGRDWPRLLEQQLKTSGFDTVRVINAGIPGHASFDALGRLYTEIWLLEPDIVLAYHGWNDIKYFHDLNASNNLLRRVRPARVDDDGPAFRVANPFIYYGSPLDRLLTHSQAYVRLRSQYLQWKLGRPRTEGVAGDDAQRLPRYSPDGPRQYELNLRLLVTAARHVGAKPVLATEARLVTPSNTAAERELIAYEFVLLSHEALVQAFADCDRSVFSVAKADGVPVFDASRKLTGRPDLFKDHVHTTGAGSQALARAAADVLVPVVREVQRPAAAK